MPSSRSSLDKRDIYYRLHKSAGYRARSAYKLIHLDEEFDLFGGVGTVVDLCAAPGSWSQVVGERMGPQLASGEARLVSLDLQPMAPLRHTTTLQADLTTPSTIPLVLTHLANKKADLVICDGAPDVTGVHDLDAYLHHQLLMAAFTLTLAILARGGTAVYKVFLSPLDPRGEKLREGFKVFFRAEEDEGEWFEEYDDDQEGQGGEEVRGKGTDTMGRRGGVWIRKPRSSRKGSGEAFLVCRNYDPSTVPLPSVFSAEALANLTTQTTGTLTLDSLAHLAGDDVQLSSEQARRWEVLKAWAGKGDLNPMAVLSPAVPSISAPKDLIDHEASIAFPMTPPAPLSPTITRTEATPGAAPHNRPPPPLSLVLPSSTHLTPPRPGQIPVPRPSTRHRQNRSSIDSDIVSPISPTALTSGWDHLGPSPLPSPISGYPPGDQPGILNLRQEYPIPPREPYALSRYVAPDLYTEPAYNHIRGDTDGAISPALSTSSKTDMFFSSGASGSGSDILPAPPRALGSSSSSGGASLGRTGSIGRGWPAGRSLLSGEREKDRAATMPTTPVAYGLPPPRSGDITPNDSWALPPRAFEAVSAPTGKSGPGLGNPGNRDRRLSGAGRVMSIAQGFGQGQAYGRERTDSINSATERVMASPLTGLPSGESIRGLASASSSSGISGSVFNPLIRPMGGGRRESQIEREEHRTTTDQEDALSPGDILEAIDGDSGGLEGVSEDWEMEDPDAARTLPHTPPAMMGLRHGREDVLGSFSGSLPVVPMQRGDGAKRRKWRLEKKLGEGAFSEVWAGNVVKEESEERGQTEDITSLLSQTAAIKLLPRRLTATNDRTRISFLREVGVLSRLSHPCIVSFIDDFETKGYYCLALERVDGGELFEVIQSPKWGTLMGQPGEAGADNGESLGGAGEIIVRRIFSELVRATAFLHACGVVHRDIKLENILLTYNPILNLSTHPSPEAILAALPPLSQPFIKLTDFGLSRFISPSSPNLTTRCGSESFAAPEIIMGKPYDGRNTDSWACGVVLYAMMTGELPFDGLAPVHSTDEDDREERRKRMLRIAKGAYKWPKEGLGSRCSQGVKTVVSWLLVRDPMQRARMDDIWEEGWMNGPGSVGPYRKAGDGADDTAGSLKEGERKMVLDGWVVLGGSGDVAGAE